MEVKRILLVTKVNLKVTFLLVGFNLFMFMLTTLLYFFLNIDLSASLLILGGEYTPLVLQGEIWRLVTASFLHANILHLLINMWVLFSFGNYIEVFYSSKKLFVIYIITAITGSLFSVIANIVSAYSSASFATDGFSLSVGASGAIFGLVGVLIGNKLRPNTYSPSIPINSTELIVFVGYNLLLGFGLNVFGSQVLINNWAHIGGLIGGILLGLILDTKHTFYKRQFKRFLEQVLFVLCLLIFVLSFLINFIFIFKSTGLFSLF